MRIGHISDLHILAFDNPNPIQFLNKRIVGGLNLLLNRSKAHSPKVVARAIEHLDSMDVDHIVISGDLTNLALDSEFVAARKIIASIRDMDRRVSIVPGNHDYYTAGAEKEHRFEKHFGLLLQSDLPNYQLDSGYPYCHFRGDVAIVGLNSCLATPWLFATGKVPPEELKAARRLLNDDALKDRFKIVVVHHPLLPDEHHSIQFNRRMLNSKEVLQTLRESNVDLILHGHNHYFSVLNLPKLGHPGTTYLCEAGSTSVESIDENPTMAGKFNIYTIDDRQLCKIESHLFESHETGFKPWQEQVFIQKLDPTRE